MIVVPLATKLHACRHRPAVISVQDDTRAGATGFAPLLGVLAIVLSTAAFPVAARAAGEVATGGSAVTAATRRWSIYGRTGLQYDSNVALDPSGQVLGPTGQPVDDLIDDPSGGAVVLGAGVDFSVLDTDRAQVSLDYDLYQSLHFPANRELYADCEASADGGQARCQLKDYDLRSNRIQGTGGLKLLPDVWVGAQAGFEQYALGGPGYSREPFITPFVSYTAGNWGLTQLLYRRGNTTYLQEPFEGLRDGPTDVATLTQTFYWGAQYATIGYEFGSERPDDSTGQAQAQCEATVLRDVRDGRPAPLCPGDYRFNYNQLFLGVGFTPGWRTSVDLMYVWRQENYTEPNSLTLFTSKRRDGISQVQAGVRRPIASFCEVALSYYGTFDDSNISFYTYDRHIVSAEVRFTY